MYRGDAPMMALIRELPGVTEVTEQDCREDGCHLLLIRHEMDADLRAQVSALCYENHCALLEETNGSDALEDAFRAVFRHELSGYFTTPVGYVFLTMYALLSGLVFVFINIGQGMSASMNLLFSGMQLPLMLIAPLLTMRLFAEEKRMRTDQLLLTSPVPLGQIVLG